MKKLMTALTICAVAGFAVGADVVSENIVGFKKLDLSNGAAELGMSFTDLASVNGDWTLSTQVFGKPLADGDQLLKFDAVNYDYNIYLFSTMTGWSVTDPLGNTSAASDPVFGIGEAFLFVPGNPMLDYVHSGQITNGTYTTVFTGGSATEFSSKVPVDITAGDIDGFCAAGDQMLVFDAANYDYNIYLFDAAGGVSVTDPLGNTTAVLLTDVVLPLGSGALYIAGSVDVTWNQVVAL